MKRFIGLDVGFQTTTVAVVSATGKQLGSQVVPTTALELVKAINKVARPRALCMEEGLLAEWLYEELVSHVDDLVVWAPMTKARGCKNDQVDAFRAAEALRTNSLDRTVFKPNGSHGRLRDLVNTHDAVVRDSTRVKNRLHTLFRSRGIGTVPRKEELFSLKRREEWLAIVPRRSECSARSLFKRLDMLTEERKIITSELAAEAKRYPAYPILISCPSFGPIRVATLMAIVVSPYRFPTKRQFWAYCGLAVITESSGDFEVRNGRVERRRQPLTRGLRHGNDMMKNIFKGAARNIVLNRSGEFYADYVRLRAANLNFGLATLTVARKLAATILSMWKHKKEYSAEQHRAARK